MGPTNTQGNQDNTEEMTGDQLDQMEQSDRLGGQGTMLGNESTDQVDGTDQNELEGLFGEDNNRQSNATSNVNSYSGMPTDGAMQTGSAFGSSAMSGMSGNSSTDTSGNGMDDPQVQRALDPNGQGNNFGNGPMAKDPVCGAMVDISTAQNTLPAPVGSTVDTLYFDSPECKELFEANPDQYIANY